MAVSDPDCPFHLLARLGTTIVGSTERLPVPVIYDPDHDLAVVSPGYDFEAYVLAADWLLSASLRQSARA